MGMFNSIFADIVCPTTRSVSKGSEIQIKWQDWEERNLDVYHAGDLLPKLQPQFHDSWVRTDYICNACSPKSFLSDGEVYIKTEEQCRHIVYVEVRSDRVERILPESEFLNLGIDDFVDDAWPPLEPPRELPGGPDPV